MIPKIIHYCWFGPKKIPGNQLRYIKEWQKIMPDFEIMLWNEHNSPMHLPYMTNALINKKWANLSNLARLYALSKHGGIYFDTDIEVLKDFTPLLSESCFLGFEDKYVDWDGCINNAVIGASPDHWFIKELYDKLIANFNGEEDAHLSSPNLTTQTIKDLGVTNYGDQKVADIRLFPTDFFYPYSWHEIFNPDKVTKNSYCIHRFARSWVDDKLKIENFKFLSKTIYYNLKWKLVKTKFKK